MGMLRVARISAWRVSEEIPTEVKTKFVKVIKSNQSFISWLGHLFSSYATRLSIPQVSSSISNMSEELRTAYEKYAPRWFKVIRWREWAQRNVDKQYWMLAVLYLPVFVYFYHYDTNPYPHVLCLYKPQTEEERNHLKKKYITAVANPFVGRNWEIDQYHGQYPPLYDVWQRRKQYPEYYGDKYNTYARDAFCETYRPGYP